MANKNCILVADDDEMLRFTLNNRLKSEGYVVLTASNGEEAMNIVQKEQVDLVILDIKMPKVDGFQVLKFIKKKFPSIKVIMLTAYVDLKNAMESKKLGADEFTGKPFDLSDLSYTIERVLHQ